MLPIQPTFRLTSGHGNGLAVDLTIRSNRLVLCISKTYSSSVKRFLKPFVNIYVSRSNHSIAILSLQNACKTPKPELTIITTLPHPLHNHPSVYQRLLQHATPASPFLRKIQYLRSGSGFPRLQLPRRLLRRTPIPSTTCTTTLLPQLPRFPLRFLRSSRRVILFIITERHPFRLSRSVRRFVRRGW